MIRILKICTVGIGVVLAGCTTYTTDECSGGNWNKIGVQDGKDGRTADRFNQHVKACALDRSEESRALYMAGRNKGLAIYCTTVRGYREGVLGQKYYGVCPPETARPFFTGYQLGSSIYQKEAQISDANDAYFAVSGELEKSSQSETQRAGLQQEQARLQGEEARLGAELKQLRDKADAMVRAAR
jgi:uncharacterized protein DUF2799